MGTELVPISSKGLNLAEINGIADIAVKSGYFAETKHLAQAAMKILFGQDYGLSPAQSLVSIYIVSGKPTLAAVAMAGLAKRAGYKIKSITHTDDCCDLEFFDRDGSSMGKSKWDKKDAAAAKTQNMDKFPRNMLWARAVSNGVKWYCSDIFFGPIYTPDELGAQVRYNAAGEIQHVEEDSPDEPEDPEALDQRRIAALQAWREGEYGPATLFNVLGRDLNPAYELPNGRTVSEVGATMQNLTFAEMKVVEAFLKEKAA
jgi:hypothetical protein